MDVGNTVNVFPDSKGIPPVGVICQLIVAVDDDAMAFNVPEFPSQTLMFGAEVMVGNS